MNTGDTIELNIDRMSFGPAAVGRIQPAGEERAIVVFVEGACPNERALVKLTKNHKSYWQAQLVSIIEPSSERTQPPCPVFQRCGGCQWQHLSYPAQVAAKTEILIHQLNRATRIPSEELKAKLQVHGAFSPYGYRARLQVHGDGKGIGFFAPASHSIVHAGRCLVAHPDIQNAWSDFLANRPLAELAKATGQFKIEWTRTPNGQVKEALNRKHAADGFTQVNPEQNEVLIKIVADRAKGGKLLLDLYGGDGNLTNSLTGSFENILSVDSYNDGADPISVQAPLKPGRLFVREKVEDFLSDQRWRDWGFEGAIDCIVTDPPRDGLREAAGHIADLQAPRVILVSCDPSTLARDLTAFTSSRYQVDAIHLIDMFPQTYHLETVVSLVLN
ncbi:MAG: class I SAM-dependent RNA methyltransferase [Deltaproteobacteria bacterium]|nr:class I SAM-dependent RNA methyltransferase [Deltaproteobacteria bacterium]